ncbi:tropomyosin [Aerococcaceae bacterium NML190938]|nr:tropomyosin [Aerococcaceae bacterium NML190938]
MKIKIQIINGAALVKGKDERIFPIFEGVEEINRFDYNLKSRNKAVRTLIDILEDDGSVLLQNFEYSLGSGKNFLEHLEIKCRDLWPDNEHIDQMFSKLKLEYDEGKDRESNEIIESFTSSTEEIDAPIILTDDLEDDEINDDIELHYENLQKVMEELQSEKSEEMPAIAEKKSPIPNKKLWPLFTIGGLLLAIVICSLAFYALSRDQPQQSVQGNASSSVSISESIVSESLVEDLSVLLEQKRFEEALKIYPQEYPLIERSIFYLGTDGIPYLEDFLKSKDYGKGWYDLAYLKKDYAKVIELKSEADTDERLTQLAVAYVKTGDIPQAEALNGQLMVASINDLILKAKEEKAIQLIKNQQYEEAKAIQAEINNDRIQLFFEELDKVNAALAETTQKLSNSELKPEDKQKLEEQKNQLESHKQTLINAL